MIARKLRDMSPGSTKVMFKQISIELEEQPRGCHLITSEILPEISEPLSYFSIGMCNIFRMYTVKISCNVQVQHTSASLSINENYDPDVRSDMEMMMNRLVSEDAPYKHTDEGPDDMPAHVKCSMMGISLNIPIKNGELALGTWQGIWLMEHRDDGGSRRVIVTMHGEGK